jgi:hypothetical protein
MTPREALYHLVIELGPVPNTTRNDNLSPKEIRLRDSVDVLKNLIVESESNTSLQSEETDDPIEADRSDLMAYYCSEASKH